MELPTKKLESSWSRALTWIKANQWALAEGECLRLWQLAGKQVPGVELADALGYVLLMQADFQRCEKVLMLVVDHPQSSFWVSHKLGDAWRGLHSNEKAILWYQRSIKDGSTSPLTYRNLLLAIAKLERRSHAIEMLEQWHALEEPTGPWLEGTRQAAEILTETWLLDWLQTRGLATAEQILKLARKAAYKLDLNTCLMLLAQARKNPQAKLLSERLGKLYREDSISRS